VNINIVELSIPFSFNGQAGLIHSSLIAAENELAPADPDHGQRARRAHSSSRMVAI
jgi:hypothetical protein